MNLSFFKATIIDLNKDQLSGLASLSFDLAKVAFIVMLFPAQNPLDSLVMEIVSKMLAGIIGLAFTYLALLSLKLKEEAKQ